MSRKWTEVTDPSEMVAPDWEIQINKHNWVPVPPTILGITVAHLAPETFRKPSLFEDLDSEGFVWPSSGDIVQKGWVVWDGRYWVFADLFIGTTVNSAQALVGLYMKPTTKEEVVTKPVVEVHSPKEKTEAERLQDFFFPKEKMRWDPDV